MTKGTASTPIATGIDMVDILEQTIEATGDGTTAQNALTISRMSVSDYANITNKTAEGRPNKMYPDRKSEV